MVTLILHKQLLSIHHDQKPTQTRVILTGKDGKARMFREIIFLSFVIVLINLQPD